MYLYTMDLFEEEWAIYIEFFQVKYCVDCTWIAHSIELTAWRGSGGLVLALPLPRYVLVFSPGWACVFYPEKQEQRCQPHLTEYSENESGDCQTTF